jgi:hypothetical protein
MTIQAATVTVAAWMARHSQLDHGFENFAPTEFRYVAEKRWVSVANTAETACGAYQAACETADSFGSQPSCLCGTGLASCGGIKFTRRPNDCSSRAQ